MTNILILEDEARAPGLLQQSLEALSVEFPNRFLGSFSTIQAAVAWFRNGGAPDLVLCDIRLSDGHSFHLFRQVPVQAPVIFTSVYDDYVLQALAYNGMEYLLKPVHEEELRHALRKAAQRRSFFASQAAGLDLFPDGTGRKRRTRIIVQKGLEQVALPLSEVVLFYTEQKVVFVLDRRGNKYIYDRPLQVLEAELDPQQFFRANRQYLIHLDYIQSFRPFDKSKLRVEMDLPGSRPAIVISQESAPRFRRWIEC
ncbi:LytTR family DNA-binding domain-containing protein [Flaviaesturariibacter amylovorans]|uniref:LytTR family DNA-binding domain-containing protein n=1 Tax=Flaviaesturariibacter amylovorans TaxID=1084520 RepID=A0ABP8GZZ2_9BACT